MDVVPPLRDMENFREKAAKAHKDGCNSKRLYGMGHLLVQSLIHVLAFAGFILACYGWVEQHPAKIAGSKEHPSNKEKEDLHLATRIAKEHEALKSIYSAAKQQKDRIKGLEEEKEDYFKSVQMEPGKVEHLQTVV